MVMWSPETYRLWSTRWKQLKAVDTIADAQQLAQKENIEFTVFDKRKIPSKNAINSCIIYENNRYWIMKNSVMRQEDVQENNLGKRIQNCNLF